MPLTDAFMRSLKPKEKAIKFSDGGGLFVLVTPRGSKLWRMAYRYEGKQKTLAFGKYPAVPLAEARRRRDQAKSQLAQGVDPSAFIRTEKNEKLNASRNTFLAIAQEMLAKQEKEGLSEVTLKKKRWLLSLVANSLHHRKIDDITASEILAPLRKVENRGRYDTANRLLATIGQVFRFAIATARAEYDPTFGLRGALASPRPRHRAALTERADFSKLVSAIWRYQGAPQTVAGLKLLALLYPRPGELRKALWSEFNLDDRTWTIPAERMKMRRPHKKPLPNLAVNVLSELNLLTADQEFLFPSQQSANRPMSENTLNVALRRLGFTKDQATAHGFRSSASTLLNESGLWSADAIEVEQSRLDTNSVRRTYNRSKYWEERKRMAEWWATQIREMAAL